MSVSAMKRAKRSVIARRNADNELIAAVKSSRMSLEDGFIQTLPKDYLRLFKTVRDSIDELTALSNRNASEADNAEVNSVKAKLDNALKTIDEKLKNESDVNAYRQAASEASALKTSIWLMDLNS